MNTVRRSLGLDIVRAIAILLVLISHFSHALEMFGFYGVELFFVLSGFLIGGIIWNGFRNATDWNLKYLLNFWSRRWWRTLPNYYLFFFLWIMFDLFMNIQMPDMGFISTFLWFGQDLTKRHDGFYGISWSLCIEEWFYLLFPLTLYFISRVLSKNASMFLTLLAFCIAPAAFRFYLHQAGINDLRTITLARLDAINYGVIVRILVNTNFIKEKKAILFLAGLFILCICGIYGIRMGFDKLISNQLLLWLVPVSSALLIPFMGSIKIEKPLKLYAVFEKLSLWSYSIYLSHIPILFIVYKLFGHLREGFLVNLSSKILGLTITLIVSAFLFKYFEVPLMNKRPKELSTNH